MHNAVDLVSAGQVWIHKCVLGNLGLSYVDLQPFPSSYCSYQLTTCGCVTGFIPLNDAIDETADSFELLKKGESRFFQVVLKMFTLQHRVVAGGTNEVVYAQIKPP